MRETELFKTESVKPLRPKMMFKNAPIESN